MRNFTGFILAVLADSKNADFTANGAAQSEPPRLADALSMILSLLIK